jgi:hypothetical protein
MHSLLARRTLWQLAITPDFAPVAESTGPTRTSCIGQYRALHSTASGHVRGSSLCVEVFPEIPR